MKAESFVYWLQGFLELGNPSTLDEDQLSKVKAHLNMVFFHDIDPKMGDKQHQNQLQAIHDREKPPKTSALDVLVVERPTNVPPDYVYDTFHKEWHAPNEKLRC